MAEVTPAQVHRSNETGEVIAVTAPSDDVEKRFDEILKYARDKIDTEKELNITHDEPEKKVVFVHPKYTINTRQENPAGVDKD